MKKILPILLMTMFLLSSIVVAQEGSEEISSQDPGTTPDSFLWGLDVAADNLALALTFDDEKKAEKALKIADERLQEIKVMIKEKKFEDSEKAKEQHNKLLSNLETDLDSSETEDKEDFKKQLDLELKIKKHKDKVIDFEAKIEIRGELTTEQQAALDNLIQSLGSDVSKLEIKIKSKKGETKIKLKEKLSDDEIEDLESDSWEAQALHVQAQAEREILRAEENIAKFEAKKTEKFGKVLGINKLEKAITDAEEEIEKAEEKIADAENDGKEVELSKEKLEQAKGLLGQAKAEEDKDSAIELAKESEDLAAESRMKYLGKTAEEMSDDSKDVNSGVNQITGQVVGDSNSDDKSEDNFDNKPEDNFDEETDFNEIEDEFEDEEESFEDELEVEDNILKEFGLVIPEYEERSVATARQYVADAKDALATSKQMFGEGEFKEAYAYGKFAKKLANEGKSGKYLKFTDAEKEELKELKEATKKAEDAAKDAEKEAEEAAKDAEDAAKDAEKEAEDAEDEAKDAEKEAEDAEDEAKDAEKEAKNAEDDDNDDNN